MHALALFLAMLCGSPDSDAAAAIAIANAAKTPAPVKVVAAEARIIINLPQGAIIKIDGQRMQSTGPRAEFLVPPIGSQMSYQVYAIYDNRVETRTVVVVPGQTTTIEMFKGVGLLPASFRGENCNT